MEVTSSRAFVGGSRIQTIEQRRLGAEESEAEQRSRCQMRKRRIEYVRVSTGATESDLKRQRRGCERFLRENGTRGIYVRAASSNGDRIIIVPAGYGLSIFPVRTGVADLFDVLREYESSVRSERIRLGLARRKKAR